MSTRQEYMLMLVLAISLLIDIPATATGEEVVTIPLLGSIGGAAAGGAVCIGLVIQDMDLSGFDIGQVYIDKQNMTIEIPKSALPEDVDKSKLKSDVQNVLNNQLKNAYETFKNWQENQEIKVTIKIDENGNPILDEDGSPIVVDEEGYILNPHGTRSEEKISEDEIADNYQTFNAEDYVKKARALNRTMDDIDIVKDTGTQKEIAEAVDSMKTNLELVSALDQAFRITTLGGNVAVAKRIGYLIAEDLAASGLSTPTGAKLTDAIVEYYSPDLSEGVNNLLQMIEEARKDDFETEVVEILKEQIIPKDTEIGEFDFSTVEMDDLKVETAKAIPSHIITSSVSGLTGSRVDIDPSEKDAWDKKFTEFTDEVNKNLDANFGKVSLAVRLLNEYSDKELTIADIVQVEKVDEVVSNVTDKELALLSAAKRRVVEGKLEETIRQTVKPSLSELRTQLSNLHSKLAELKGKVEKINISGEQLDQLQQEVDGLKKKNRKLQSSISTMKSRLTWIWVGIGVILVVALYSFYKRVHYQRE